MFLSVKLASKLSCVLVLVEPAGVRGGGRTVAQPCVLVLVVQAGFHGVLGGGSAGACHASVCGCLCWPDDEGEEQLVQLEDFHSLGRLGHKLVLIGVIA